MTEMWFIIIFGSIPALRTLFVRLAQNIKIATGRPRKRRTRSAYGTASSKLNEVWVQLSGSTHPWATYDSSPHDAFSGVHSANRNRGSSTNHVKTSTGRINRAMGRKKEGWERSESEERIVDADDASVKQPWAVGQPIGSTEADVELGDVDASKEAGKIVQTVQIKQCYT